MSTCLITMVRDERDIIEPFLRHFAWHVDWLYVADNMSDDGTRAILERLSSSLPLTVIDDTERRYWQSRKMTALAQRALREGHAWAIPADADELWYVGADPDRRIADWIAGLAPDVHLVYAELYNHIPTALDPGNEENPYARICWRKRERAPLGKVACRLHEGLVISAGNHSASYPGLVLTAGGLVVRHFSWRSPEQYVRKVQNGVEAYRDSGLPEEIGAHWRMWEGVLPEQIIEHYLTWFYSKQPKNDDTLIYDPAPYRRKE